MEQEVKNFGRFFALLRKMPYRVEEDEWRGMVRNATSGRTGSLHEMTKAEYEALCNSLDYMVARKTTELRYRRSCVLKQMQRMGVDTTDWARIDALCMDARIAGKQFRRLSEDELRGVEVKLRGIERKGGLSVRRSTGAPVEGSLTYFLMPNGQTKGLVN